MIRGNPAVAVSRADRLARVATEVFSPALVVLLLPIAVAWQATGHRLAATLGWGLVMAMFSSVLPMVFILRGVRRGLFDGHHVRNREGRLVPLVLGFVSSTFGLAILVFGRAPRDVLALNAAMLASVAACLLITRWWKISLHMAVAGGAAAALMFTYGVFLLVTVPIVILIGWSRVVVRDHSIPQVIAGAVVATLVGGVAFALVHQ